jgi:DNA topoisomerase-1
VAVLCNHQRAPPKTHNVQVEKMQEALGQLEADVKAAKKDLKDAKAEKNGKKIEMANRKLVGLQGRLHKKEIAMTDKQENKTIALGTSKLNYLDPRISIAWCKRFNVPIEKVYNATQRKKFRWAVEMTEADFEF